MLVHVVTSFQPMIRHEAVFTMQRPGRPLNTNGKLAIVPAGKKPSAVLWAKCCEHSESKVHTLISSMAVAHIWRMSLQALWRKHRSGNRLLLRLPVNAQPLREQYRLFFYAFVQCGSATTLYCNPREGYRCRLDTKSWPDWFGCATGRCEGAACIPEILIINVRQAKTPFFKK